VKQGFVEMNFGVRFDDCMILSGSPRNVPATHQLRPVHFCESLHFHQFIWLLLAACKILKFWKRRAYRGLIARVANIPVVKRAFVHRRCSSGSKVYVANTHVDEA